jgi:squalene-associated FAD-dependent desaturase
MTEKRVVVIGGGLAGVTAALDCAGEGAEVTLLESRGRLGGAAYSFMRDGLRVDNGQHVFLRCCTAYRELLKRSGADGMVTLQPRLRIPIVGPDGRQYVLQRSDAPAPLQLAGALARYRLLSVADRLAVARAMTALRRIDPNDPATDLRAFGDWLTEQGQSATAMAAIWELIARPTLNLLPADASLAQAAQVFQVGLLQHCTAGDIGWARVPLSEIHDVALRRTLARAGVDVGLRKGVTAVVCDRGGFQIEISGSPTLRADAVVLAVPPDRAARLTPPETGIDASRVLRLGSSPIVNLHVVYDRPVFHAPFAAAVGSPVQWIFDRTESSGAAGGQ